jgi:hypothetical protein
LLFSFLLLSRVFLTLLAFLLLLGGLFVALLCVFRLTPFGLRQSVPVCINPEVNPDIPDTGCPARHYRSFFVHCP